MISLQTIALAFSLSGDAFAASLAKGANYPRLSLKRTILIAGSFGLLEALAPLIGWVIGRQFTQLITGFDHWIAFVLLGLLGARMVWRGFHADEEAKSLATPTWAAVAVTALGTSVDATVVGVTLALVSDNIPLTIVSIGVVTFGMTLIGLRIGRAAGLRIGGAAEVLGGLGLIAIGANILYQHLSR